VVEFLFARDLPPAEITARIRRDPTIRADVRRRALALAEAREQARVTDEAEQRTDREARSVVESLSAQGLPAEEITARIRRDPTIRADVRRRALALAEARERARVTDEANRLVESLFDKLLLREDVLESLRTDHALSEPVRTQALALAAPFPGDEFLLMAASWSVVRRPDAGATAYRLALRQAEAVYQLNPNHVAYLNLLGVAQYRTGKYQVAVATLARCEQLATARTGGSFPANLAFLALAYYRLGQIERARDTLQRLREAMKKPERAGDGQAQEFWREAETIEQDLVFPADPFAVGP
jgi:tetratricopeptide (TPR) repeat protein